MRRISVVASLLVLILAVALTAEAGPVRGGAFTTFNAGIDGHPDDLCQNSAVNCNIYRAKEYVWINGGPAANALRSDGDYFFAVLEPGAQSDPNDGGPRNLSDDFDCYLNRTFAITNGEISWYEGAEGACPIEDPFQEAHWLDDAHDDDGAGALIRLFPYADTANQGGVYVLAICSLGNGYPVDPRECKYDAFKVQEGKKHKKRKKEVSFVLKGMKFEDIAADGNKDPEDPGLPGWTINISGTGPDGEPFRGRATTDASGQWEYQSTAYEFRHGEKPRKVSVTVCEALESGWTQSYPREGCHSFSFRPDGFNSFFDLDFGNWGGGGGTLEVKKIVDWRHEEPDPDATFTVCIEGPSYPAPTPANGGCQAVGSGGGVLTWAGLRRGEYRVYEDPLPGPEWEVEGSGQTVWVDDGRGRHHVEGSRKHKKGKCHDAHAVITNTHKRVKTGKLIVKKWIDWNGFEPEAVQFEICVVGPAPDTTTRCQTIDESGTLVFADLVSGTYTVIEDPGPGWEVTILGSPVEVRASHKHHKDKKHKAVVKVKNRRVEEGGGRLDVVKIADWNGETPQDVSFSICVAGPGGAPVDPECQTASFEAADFAGGVAQATVGWTGLDPGEYVISEDPGAGWRVGISPVPVTVVEGQTATATVTNSRLRGRLEVTKVVESATPPDPSQSFEICLTGPAPSTTVQCLPVGAEGGLLAFEELVAGEYTVTETDPGAEWTVAIVPQGGVVVVPAGGLGVATVTNSRAAAGSIVVRKVTIPDNDTVSEFSFTASWASNGFTLRNGESVESGPLSPGTYSVSEALAPGWATQSSCSDGSAPASISLEPGETVTCTFTNTSGFLEVTKTLFWGQFTPVDTAFEICLNQGGVQLACQPVVLLAGDLQETVVWRAPPGAYEVTETDPGPGWQVDLPAEPIVVTGGGTSSAEVINSRLGGN